MLFILYSIYVFEKRSYKLERIDTGDYTTGEFRWFLREIRFINRFLGDDWALKKLLDAGKIEKDERIVLFNTGSGIKYLEAFDTV